MDLGGIGWDVVAWIGLAQKRVQWKGVANAVMNRGVP